MKLTRSAGYALVAVGHIARNSQGSPVLARTIAKRYRIPLDYLLKIMQQLVRAGVLNSVRGPRGGFTLPTTPNKINLLEIIEAVDGPFISRPKVCDGRADIPFNRQLADVFENAAQQAAKALSKTTLAQFPLDPDTPEGKRAKKEAKKTTAGKTTKKKATRKKTAGKKKTAKKKTRGRR